MDISVLRRMVLAKYLYNKGVELLGQKMDMSNMLAVMHFHDAVEVFLHAIADKLRVKKIVRHFMDYWPAIAEATNGEIELPYKSAMKKLNSMRVGIKHTGLFQHQDECVSVANMVRHFFEEACPAFMDGKTFVEIYLADLVENEKVKLHLKQAERLLNEGKHKDSNIASAVAFKYIDFRSISGIDLKISPFWNTTDRNLNAVNQILTGIIEVVNLLSAGLDPIEHKKFRSLTPEVSLNMKREVMQIVWGPWSHSDEINQNRENSVFCFNFVLDTALKIQSKKFNLVDLRIPQKIKTIRETPLYSLEKISEPTDIIVPSNVMIEYARRTAGPGGEYWRVKYEGKEGFVAATDCVWIET